MGERQGERASFDMIGELHRGRKRKKIRLKCEILTSLLFYKITLAICVYEYIHEVHFACTNYILQIAKVCYIIHI